MLCLALFLTSPAWAGSDSWSLKDSSAPHQVTQLDWANPKEVLLYRSCGCGDSCWEARLYKKEQIKKQTVKGAPLVSLRCDCEKLSVSMADDPETNLEPTCRRFENADKFEQIDKEMHQLSAPSAR